MKSHSNGWLSSCDCVIIIKTWMIWVSSQCQILGLRRHSWVINTPWRFPKPCKYPCAREKLTIDKICRCKQPAMKIWNHVEIDAYPEVPSMCALAPSYLSLSLGSALTKQVFLETFHYSTSFVANEYDMFFGTQIMRERTISSTIYEGWIWSEYSILLFSLSVKLHHVTLYASCWSWSRHASGSSLFIRHSQNPSQLSAHRCAHLRPIDSSGMTCWLYFMLMLPRVCQYF
jgi:hypothetical protein